jgi:hypothetical protein
MRRRSDAGLDEGLLQREDPANEMMDEELPT